MGNCLFEQKLTSNPSDVCDSFGLPKEDRLVCKVERIDNPNLKFTHLKLKSKNATIKT